MAIAVINTSGDFGRNICLMFFHHRNSLPKRTRQAVGDKIYTSSSSSHMPSTQAATHSICFSWVHMPSSAHHAYRHVIRHGLFSLNIYYIRTRRTTMESWWCIRWWWWRCGTGYNVIFCHQQSVHSHTYIIQFTQGPSCMSCFMWMGFIFTTTKTIRIIKLIFAAPFSMAATAHTHTHPHACRLSHHQSFLRHAELKTHTSFKC